MTNPILKSYNLCTERDEFIEDTCIWIVTLSDGTEVFQDDERPGLKVSSAWKRLGCYLKDYPDDKITRMFLRFGTHKVELPSNKDCYFYSHGMLQGIMNEHASEFHIVGWNSPETNDIECVWYKTPELVVSETKHRPVEACSKDQLIGKIPA